MKYKHRLFGLLILFVGLFSVLAARLLWVQAGAVYQALNGSKAGLTRQSVLQREQRLVLSTGRGHFVDSQGEPITGRAYSSLLVFPMGYQYREPPEELEKLTTALGTTPEIWQKFRIGLKEPGFWQGHSTIQQAKASPARLSEDMIARISGLKLEGLAVVPYEERYIPPYPAAQLIGFIGQNPQRILAEFAPMVEADRMLESSRIGVSGLEKSFEPLLTGIGGTSISLYTDGLRRPMPGLGYRIHTSGNPYYPLRVITTLNLPLQMKLEKLADELGLGEGAIVVLDAQSAEIRALVSRPHYNPDQINLKSGGWMNRGFMEAAPGSVFKTVAAVSALEHGVAEADEEFECNGSLGKYHLNCWKKEGHGKLSLRQAFAESCNVAFAKLITRLSPEELKETADKLGLGHTVGWTGNVLQYRSFSQLDHEGTGQIWAAGTDPRDPGVMVQTAIGQRDVRMTPLQAANMVVTMLNQGHGRRVRAVKEIQYNSGRQLIAFPEQKWAGGDRAYRSAVKQVTEWMADVVEQGTGASLKSAQWELAGKSGTAQVPLAGGIMRYNQWFVGYGPRQEPKYAVAVVNLNRTGTGPENQQLFRAVMDTLSELKRGL